MFVYVVNMLTRKLERRRAFDRTQGHPSPFGRDLGGFHAVADIKFEAFSVA